MFTCNSHEAKTNETKMTQLRAILAKVNDGDEAPRKKSKRKYEADPPLPLGLWGSDEPIQVEEHHSKRGQSGDRYERYKAARTVIEYEQLGGSARDLRFDLARGLVRCLGEFARPAPATPSPAPPIRLIYTHSR